MHFSKNFLSYFFVGLCVFNKKIWWDISASLKIYEIIAEVLSVAQEKKKLENFFIRFFLAWNTPRPPLSVQKKVQSNRSSRLAGYMGTYIYDCLVLLYRYRELYILYSKLYIPYSEVEEESIQSWNVMQVCLSVWIHDMWILFTNLFFFYLWEQSRLFSQLQYYFSLIVPYNIYSQVSILAIL